jgi:hypothetical protein
MRSRKASHKVPHGHLLPLINVGLIKVRPSSDTWLYTVPALCLPADFFFENYLFVAYPHLNRLHFEINFAFRLLVRGVTGFNKACPHLLSARLRQFKKMADCTYPHPNGGLKSGKGEG